MKNNFYFNAWKQSFDFKGRTDRKEYWLFVLTNIIISYLLGSMSKTLESIYLLISVFPLFSITCRRLNDVKKSFLWCVPGFLWCFILYLGFILPALYKIISYFLIGVLGVLISPSIIIVLIYTLKKSILDNNNLEETK